MPLALPGNGDWIKAIPRVPTEALFLPAEPRNEREWGWLLATRFSYPLTG
jgi:hypothetical protein